MLKRILFSLLLFLSVLFSFSPQRPRRRRRPPPPPHPRLKMQFVKTALSSVWTRERRGGPLYVNTGRGKKLSPSLQLIDTLHLSSCSRGPLAGSAELPKTHNFTSANTVFIHLTPKTRPHVANLCVFNVSSPFFFHPSLAPSIPLLPFLPPSFSPSPLPRFVSGAQPYMD